VKFLRVLFFLTFSILDVTVRAHELSLLKAPVLEPENCLAQSVVCTISTYKDTKYEMIVGSSKFRMGPESVLSRLDRNQYALLKGQLWLESSESTAIETEFGTVQVRGQTFIEREPKRVMVGALQGDVRLQPKGGEELIVEAGFENSLHPVSNHGKAETGIPQLLDPKGTLRKLGELYSGPKQEFISWTKEWLLQWPTLVENASQFHQDLMKRTLASEHAKEARALARRQAMDAENRAIIKRFRKKVLDEE
jgi:hypothetical protein